MSELQRWWDGTVGTISFRVIDDSLPASTQPLKIVLTADGDIMVYPKNQLQVWSGSWSSTHRSAINLEFPVMVAGRPNISIGHHVVLLLHSNLYASSTVGVRFMLAPWQPLTDGPCFEDLLADLRTCPRPPTRARYVESGGSSSSQEQ